MNYLHLQKLLLIVKEFIQYIKLYKGIEKNVEKTEKELCSIFDSAQTDCMEVDMGLLVRRKQKNRYEWLIEL